MQKIYELEPKEVIDVMGPEETKKCKVVPKKYNYISDILPNNKRIEGETILELNKNEIARAMTLANVYLIGEDDSELLLNPENYYKSLEEKKDKEEEEEEPSETEINTEPVSQVTSNIPKQKTVAKAVQQQQNASYSSQAASVNIAELDQVNNATNTKTNNTTQQQKSKK